MLTNRSNWSVPDFIAFQENSDDTRSENNPKLLYKKPNEIEVTLSPFQEKETSSYILQYRTSNPRDYSCKDGALGQDKDDDTTYEDTENDSTKADAIKSVAYEKEDKMKATDSMENISKSSSLEHLMNYQELINENEKLKNDLNAEKLKMIILKPKYDYLERNFDTYIKLKEHYMHLTEIKQKEDIEESMDTLPQRPPTKLSNKITQTYSSIICQYCTKTSKIVESRAFKDFVDCQSSHSFCVSHASHMKLMNKLQHLEQSIAHRERLYENRPEKAQIILLNTIISKNESEINELKRKNKHGQYCLDTLQRIIGKLIETQTNSEMGFNFLLEKLTLEEQKLFQQIKRKIEKTAIAEEGSGVKTKYSNNDFRGIDCVKPINTVNCLFEQIKPVEDSV